MGTGTGQTGLSSPRGEIFTTAATGAYARLMIATGGRAIAHPRPDGGLICEDRTRFARPVLWRILPDGTLLPDRRYIFARRGFVTAPAPAGA